MKRPVKAIILVMTACMSLGLFSCLDISCTDETTAFVRANFYEYSSKNAVIPDSITLYGNEMSIKVYDNEKVQPPALIPLKDSTSLTMFIIMINNVTDTLKFHYWSYSHLISKECGYSVFHTVDTVLHTGNIIDSVATVNKDITTLNVENIRIYY